MRLTLRLLAGGIVGNIAGSRGLLLLEQVRMVLRISPSNYFLIIIQYIIKRVEVQLPCLYSVIRYCELG